MKKLFLLILLSISAFGQVVTNPGAGSVPNATTTTPGKVRVGEIDYVADSGAAAAKPCNASRVNTKRRRGYGNRGVDTCTLMPDGSTYAWVDMRPSFNVQHYGAIGDGITDDSPAILAANTAAAVVGGVVEFPAIQTAGKTVYKITQTIPQKQGVVYRGAGSGPNSSAISAASIYIKPVGAIYAFTDDGVGKNGIVIEGLTIDLSDADCLGGVYIYGTSYSRFSEIRIRFAATTSSARKYGFRIKGGAAGAYSNRFEGCDGYNGGVQGGQATLFFLEDSANNNYINDCLASGIDKPYIVDSTNATTFNNAGGDFGMVSTFTFQNNARQNSVIGGRSEHGGVIGVALSRASNVVTATHAGTFKFYVGQVIIVNGASDGTFNIQNGSYATIASVPDDVTFTYAQTAADATTTANVSGGVIATFDNGSYNNQVIFPQQINAPFPIVDANATYNNYLIVNDQLNQFGTTQFLSIGKTGVKIWGGQIYTGGVSVAIGSFYKFANAGATPDIGAHRDSAGVLGISDGVTSSNYRDIKLRSLTATGSITMTSGGGALTFGNDGSGVSLYSAPNNAWRFSTNTSTHTQYIDFPRIIFRDQSAGLATTGSNINGTWIFARSGPVAMAFSATAPTVSSAGTSPSIPANNGTAAFTVNVGTGGTAHTIVLTMPTAANGWICTANNITATAANRADQAVRQTASTTTSVTLQNQTVSTGAALAFTASDVVHCQCTAY